MYRKVRQAVNPAPAPNEIDIGGPAVAVSCPCRDIEG